MENIAIFYFLTMTIYCSSTRNIYCYSICSFCSYSICPFCWYNIHKNYNFITHRHWIISNTFEILTILTKTYARIPTINFFAFTIIFTFIVTCLIITFLFWITCCTIEFVFAITWSMFYHCFSFILTFMFLFEHIFLEIRHYNLQYICLN